MEQDMYRYEILIGNLQCPKFYASSDYIYRSISKCKQAARDYLDATGQIWIERHISIKRKGAEYDQHIPKAKGRIKIKEAQRLFQSIKSGSVH